MPRTMRYQNPECQDRLAAEYVLGTLHGRARQRFEALLAHEPGLQRQVGLWEERLHGLGEGLEPITPPEHVWHDIARGLDGGRGGFWNNAPLWRNLTMLAASLLLAVGVFLAVPGVHIGEMPDHMVVVNNARSEPAWVVQAQMDRGRFKVKTMDPVAMGPEQVCVLWLTWEDGMAKPLGVLPEQPGEMTMPMPEVAGRDPMRARVAVSIEPGNMNIDQMGRPSEQIVFQGPWVRI